MNYQHEAVRRAAETLKQKFESLTDKAAIMRAVELKALFDQIKTLPAQERGSFGKEVNALRQELQGLIDAASESEIVVEPIDVTAPFDVNTPEDKRPKLLPTEQGSIHPITAELTQILSIFYRMGFTAEESRQLDDDYHMFESLNFPLGHPARDDWDTFMTDDGLIAPAHTSTMQNRVLKKYKDNLANGDPIACVVPGRTYRNEDLDARHEHTFLQIEGVYVNKGVQVGDLVGTLKAFLVDYFGQAIEVKITPFYFPFTEPSFEFSLTCPFCAPEKTDCRVCP
jgi:phenylalanyl-tRNA synthetase alpha chain